MTGVTIDHLVTEETPESGGSPNDAARGQLHVLAGVMVAASAVGFSILM